MKLNGGVHVGQTIYRAIQSRSSQTDLEHGYLIGDVAKRLGVTPKSLHDWKARYGEQSGQWQKNKASDDEIRTLKAEVQRLTMERDILKEAVVDSICQCNTLLNYLLWRIKLQNFSRS